MLASTSLSLTTLVVSAQFAFAENNGDNNMMKRHIQLVTPQPYEWDEYGPTNPLNPDGSDYPCKVPQGESFTVSGSPTEMVIGEAQVVSFAGWAVHGGGSCQFALTEGQNPTKDSAWKVIHSVEGGCPKANVAGNLANGQSPDNYTFSVPDDFEPGDYTFAWTWVNRIAGQPEFYMNCAPVAVKAAAGSTRRVKERREAQGRTGRRSVQTSDYPDLFLANIGDASNGCDTSAALSQQIAIAYPYPGDSVSYPNGADNLFRQPCDGNPRNGNNNNNSTTSDSGGSSASSSSSALAASATTAAASGTAGKASTSTTSVTRAQTTRVASSSSSSSSSGPASTLSSQSLTSDVASATASTAAGASSTASLGGSCTDGHLLCVDETQFSTCTGGKWTTPQDLASNARCTVEGESVGLNITNVS